MSVPDRMLTKDLIDEFFDKKKYTDRQRLCWALRTENHVRLSKLETRDDEEAFIDNLSLTLDSEYLFDLYPSTTTDETNVKEPARLKRKKPAGASRRDQLGSRRTAVKTTATTSNPTRSRYPAIGWPSSESATQPSAKAAADLT